VLILATFVFAESAFAQTAFVQGGIALDIRRFSGPPEDRVFDGNVSTVMIGVGGHLTSMISAGVEFDTGRDLVVAPTNSVTIAGRPETITTTYTSKRQAVSALFGLHSPGSHKVRVSTYAGLAFTALRRRITTTAPAIVLSAQPPPTEFTDLAATPIVGVDVSAAITRKLAIVGVMRAQALTFGSELHGFSVRPGAGVRVSFP